MMFRGSALVHTGLEKALWPERGIRLRRFALKPQAKRLESLRLNSSSRSVSS